MIYGAADLARGFRTVRTNTMQIAEDIPEANYDFAPAPGCRSVRRLLVHIGVMPRLQHRIHGIERVHELAGFDFFGGVRALLAEEDRPRTKAEIVGLLRSEGEAFAAWMESLSPDFLAEQVNYPPGMQPAKKTRFEMILSAKEHEMHHRGQLMLIERMLGMVPHLTTLMQAAIQARQAQK